MDEIICTGKPYDQATPIKETIEYAKELKAAGHIIIVFTARGMNSNNGNVGRIIASLSELTLHQLYDWGMPYDELWFGKPSYDILIDDKSVNSLNSLKGEIERLSCKKQLLITELHN